MRILLSFQLRLLPRLTRGEKKEHAPCLGFVVFFSLFGITDLMGE